jgi:HAD superfamily hydrolase (TIGR01490 family)
MTHQAKTKKQPVAVFDIDGTLFRSSLLIAIVEHLIDVGLFPQKAAKHYQAAYHRWLNRQGPYEDYLEGVITAFSQNINRLTYEDLAYFSREINKIHQNRIYRYTRDLIEKLKKRNYYLLAISGSPKLTIEGFCRRWGFNKIYGRRFEVNSKGRFTGQTLDETLIKNKAEILKRAVAKENLTLKGSVGVGDTETDIPFLKLVEQPICFNPNRRLYQYARRAKWKIVVERKDVIYQI